MSRTSKSTFACRLANEKWRSVCVHLCIMLSRSGWKLRQPSKHGNDPVQHAGLLSCLHSRAVWHRSADTHAVLGFANTSPVVSSLGIESYTNEPLQHKCTWSPVTGNLGYDARARNTHTHTFDTNVPPDPKPLWSVITCWGFLAWPIAIFDSV